MNNLFLLTKSMQNMTLNVINLKLLISYFIFFLY